VGLPCYHQGVAYAWHNRASLLPLGCGRGGFNKVLSFGPANFYLAKIPFIRKLGIALFHPMTCLRHANPTPIDFTLGFCSK
jgi:hypothetical protein